MFTRTLQTLLVSSLLLTGLTGCDDLGALPDDGGGAGVGEFSFTTGYVFVRPDDRNIYAANSQSLTAVGQLTTGGGNSQPSVSNDGRRVVFIHSEGADTEIQYVSSAGGTPTPVLASDPSRTRLRSPIFAADNSSILFTYDFAGSSFIGIVDEDGSNFRTLAGGAALSYASPSLYPDGEYLLAAAGSTPSQLTQLERIHIATGQASNVTNTLGLEATTLANRVELSPDGTMAAFDGVTGSGATRIFVIGLGSGATQQLTDYPGEPSANDRFPTWVGNGSVAFGSDTGGSDQVYVLPATATKTSGGLTLPAAVEPRYGP